jgi:hypothetical protein
MEEIMGSAFGPISHWAAFGRLTKEYLGSGCYAELLGRAFLARLIWRLGIV